ncbi:MAG TPA: tripartite tricarboxylate transporter TctB family protein [Burkholderiales bacterium]|nr:tripartite tricarboxylate transporter TctB family protein [Burkholderiales bacterium]
MTDRVIFACAVAVAAVYLYATTLIPSLEIGDPLGPKAFPRLLGVCLLIAAGLLFVETWKERGRGEPLAERPAARDYRHLWVVAAVVAWTAAYYAAFEKLGYVLATAVYLFALMAWFNRGRWLANVLTSLLFSALSYALFLRLDVNLPKGVLPF